MEMSAGSARAGPTAAAIRATLRRDREAPGALRSKPATVEAARPETRRLMTEGACIMASYVFLPEGSYYQSCPAAGQRVT